jgi:hypothetical protein
MKCQHLSGMAQNVHKTPFHLDKEKPTEDYSKAGAVILN